MQGTWTRVRAGEAEASGVRTSNAGWIGRFPSGALFFVWRQGVVRGEGPFYAGDRVDAAGHVERYTGCDVSARPAWFADTLSGVRSTWLCDAGTLREAKAACSRDASEGGDSERGDSERCDAGIVLTVGKRSPSPSRAPACS